MGDTVSIRICDKQDNLNLDLAAGRLDAGLADYSVWQSFLDTQDGGSARLYGPQIPGGVFGPGIGLRKTDGDLAERLDTAIDALALLWQN